MYAREGKHQSFSFETPPKICLKHIFKWAAYRCFQSCSSPGEGLRANQRRWHLGMRALLSLAACFSGKMQINSFPLLWTTSDKGVLGQRNPFNMPVFPHCTLSLYYLQSERQGVGRELCAGCAGNKREMHSNEGAGNRLWRCVQGLCYGKSLELGGRPTYSLVSVSHHLWVTLGKGQNLQAVKAKVNNVGNPVNSSIQ